MAITEKDIYEYIGKIGKNPGAGTTVWAVKMPSVFNMAVYGPMANVFALQYNILHITANEIVIIGVDGAGRLTPLYVCLDKKEIKEIKMKKKLMGYQVELITINGSLKYTINKVMIGSPFHKANFENVITLLKEWSVL